MDPVRHHLRLRTHGWIGGAAGGFETTDGGATWHRVPMGLATNKLRILPRPDGGKTVFALGHDLYRLDLAPDAEGAHPH